MGLPFRFRFWVQVQCFRSRDRDQHALTQVHHPCHLTNSTKWVHLMANNSSSAFASDGKIDTALLNFGNAKGCVYFASRGCFASWGKIKHMVLYWRIRTGSDWWFSKFCGSGLDSDWKISQSAHLWFATEMSTDQDWIGLDQDWSQFWPDRTGSDYNFFEIWQIRTESDWENFLLF